MQFSAKPTTWEIFQARILAEPLVPIGGEPDPAETADLATALLGYGRREAPDDLSSLTGFLEKHPQSAWCAALLVNVGLEYFNTARYSLALRSWEAAWPRARTATDSRGRALADRGVGELAFMYARLGRMAELEALLKSVENRGFSGAATERIAGAREGLWNMRHRPDTAFKCGPFALLNVLRSHPHLFPAAASNAMLQIFEFPSTHQGCSLSELAELSRRTGMGCRMVFRDGVEEFPVPSVVHWKAGHYAAIVERSGDHYRLQDSTFGPEIWATRAALGAEASGYFLLPPGDLPAGWRWVGAREGATIWGKGNTGNNDPDPHTPNDPKKDDDDCKAKGMAVANVHLMLVSLNIVDTPVGYSPPVGPPVEFTVRYNQRDANQPANFTYSGLSPKWTCDWISFITDNPKNPLSNVKYYARGGGTRTFSGYDTNSGTFAFQQFDSTRLTRTGTNRYAMMHPDRSQLVFAQSDGSLGTSRRVFLTQVIDPFGNAVTLTYDAFLRVVAITDAIGQVTTLAYATDNPSLEPFFYLIHRVTDPFGRFATFEYDVAGRLGKITDVIGLSSEFVYRDIPDFPFPGATTRTDFVRALTTPYGTTAFQSGNVGSNANSRFLETLYPDGSRDRVEYNQTGGLVRSTDPAVPAGMSCFNALLHARNTYYWSRTACATSYGDHTKARVYHWLHTDGGSLTAGILESSKEPLEHRVWYNYPGQNTQGGSAWVGTSRRPTSIGRVLDDGTTQLSRYEYDGFGHVVRSVDPVGRTFSYLYASNGIDLLEVRQTRAGRNELLSRAVFNAQHLPVIVVDAAGQTNSFGYSPRGQLLTRTNPRGETTRYTYDDNGLLVAIDGPLPGTNDMVTATYDALGRMLTRTDESGHTLRFEHDDLDRLTKITHPDDSFEQITHDRLDATVIRDRAGRLTRFEFDAMRQLRSKTDPLGRVTLFDWCRCGAIKGLTDPMGRTTSWLTDVQSRQIAKVYPDGSQVQYHYEGASSRVRQVVDEKGQVSRFAYNPDNTVQSVAYFNAGGPTPGVRFDYDPNYRRRVSMTDGSGTTRYWYHPVAPTPTLGANQLAGVDGPLPDDTITHEYDELGRPAFTAINGVAWRKTYDAAGRVVSETNILGAFSHNYDGASLRPLASTFPNGLTMERGYGGGLEDHGLHRITHRNGAVPVSEFRYVRDRSRDRIVSWSQQAGAEPPSLHTFGYDALDQLLSVTMAGPGGLNAELAYTYDLVGNRLSEQQGTNHNSATYNALNQPGSSTARGTARTNEWDARNRLVAINAAGQRTEFTYDGMDRMVGIRRLTNGMEAGFRRLVWCDNRICEERDAGGAVTKRFFPQGFRIESGPLAGSYFQTRDHLGSLREVTDAGGGVRARFVYDPYGRRRQVGGDLDADFGFAGMFRIAEAGLEGTRFRIYDSELGRWLSRDPLRDAELREGPNLYAYVGNNPINGIDPLGLCCEKESGALDQAIQLAATVCSVQRLDADRTCAEGFNSLGGSEGVDFDDAMLQCERAQAHAELTCRKLQDRVGVAAFRLMECLQRGCVDSSPCPSPRPDDPYRKVRFFDPSTGEQIGVIAY